MACCAGIETEARGNTNDIEDIAKTIDRIERIDNVNNYVKQIMIRKDLNNDKIPIEKLYAARIVLYSLIDWLNRIHRNHRESVSDCKNGFDIFDIENLDRLKTIFTKELHSTIRREKCELRKSILNHVLPSINFDDYSVWTSSSGLEKDEYLMLVEILKILIVKRPTRNVSGITSITVITAPFPNGQKFSCSHNCYYCPNEPAHEGNGWQAQPRSYLYREPAMLRANENGFKAFDQMNARMTTLYKNGHVVDKLEIIVEGGTFTEYPPEYLEVYHRDIFYAANTFFDRIRHGIENRNSMESNRGLIREPLSIREEVEINKTARVHIIGICIETRPDALDDQWLRRFREWGITRIQLGVQHTDNAILKKVNRGHTIEQAEEAIEYLKDNCFKIDIHIMPDLPMATPQGDRDMFDYIYSNVCPDQMKVYPCEIIPWTVIEKWYKKGLYKPYFEDNPQALVDVVKYSLIKCPPYVRLPRIIRDIPNDYIESGNTYANMRQMIDTELDKAGEWSMEIRSREIGRHVKYYKRAADYNIYEYSSRASRQAGSVDYFISYESLDGRALFGFLRLRFVGANANANINRTTAFDVLKNRGLIRELHVYGDTNAVGVLNKNKRGCQHTGIGRGLLRIAERITRERGIPGIVVISGEGVKGYYEKNGYYELDTFMVKDFNYLWVFISWIVGFFRRLSVRFFRCFVLV